ncbi:MULTISPECIES: ferritin-like domain-containing protein [unclassified Mycobacterium]|uniref:ferritin-like domain-containing protein n=1 Tax=unclassified Mycobacterium TaxID=2642494 RepID=UPI000FB422BA|nr:MULTISPECIES: ferritin-like domain-containing protein [unclassified Mycobacterium]MDP7703367.1 ferritin-like domain-containing protein [Mycobacterium sp. TY815]MDP7721850.1 ferritin-like domain-containing protein [Mycobacterium sp. TY814]RUP06097.1 MAG: ferritin-like domain-containing protein [Mycobacterium sp.]
MTAPDTTRLLAQLRTLLDLTNTEIQIAETRVIQARTEAVRRELSQNAENGRERAEAIQARIRDLGGYPDVIGPFLGRAAAAVKALTEQAEPFDEALLGDLALEDQLLDRARYTKALAIAAKNKDVENLADRLITAHTATVEWLTTVLAEDALGGPAALRRTPVQMAAGTAVKLVNLPVTWSARGIDRAVESLRTAGPAFRELVERGGNAGEIAAKALSASQNAALRAAERVTRSEGADNAADALHEGRESVGVLDASELPIANYDELNISDAVAAIKDLTTPRDVRVVIAYEEAHKARQRIVSAGQTRVAAIAKEAVGIS